jgi:hypothetical protein
MVFRNFERSLPFLTFLSSQKSPLFPPRDENPSSPNRSNGASNKIYTDVNNTGANLPPVSMTPVANNGNNIRLLRPESEFEGKNVSTV